MWGVGGEGIGEGRQEASESGHLLAYVHTRTHALGTALAIRNKAGELGLIGLPVRGGPMALHSTQ